MKKELKDRILAYNRAAKDRAEKAGDLEILIGELAKLPPGQLKKVLTEPVLAVLARHGVKMG